MVVSRCEESRGPDGLQGWTDEDQQRRDPCCHRTTDEDLQVARIEMIQPARQLPARFRQRCLLYRRGGGLRTCSRGGLGSPGIELSGVGH